MTKPGHQIALPVCVGMLLIMAGGAVSASNYDPDTGVITVNCLEVLVNGARKGKYYRVGMALDDTTLSITSLRKTPAVSPCTGTFDVVSFAFRDLISSAGDDIEISAVLLDESSLSVTSLLFRTDLISEDLTIKEDSESEIALPVPIDTGSLMISLEDGSPAPDFIGLVDSSLHVQPRAGDAGDYVLRLVWGNQVEYLDITVNPGEAMLPDTGVQPESLPTFSSLNLYNDASPFNAMIPDDAGIDPASDLLVESIAASLQMVIQVGQFSTPVYLADSSTETTTVDLACGEPWELGVTRMVSIPIPDWAVPSLDTDGEPPVEGCGEESGQDNFMVILDLENRCEFDFWQARMENGRWVASFGVGISMDGSGVNAHGLSARGSGFAFLGGVIWPDELAAGRIAHPLAFSYEFTRAGGPVAPATDSDGVTDAAFAIPEGAILQLDPAFDLESLDLQPYELAIARALQEYGMILVDSGSAGPVGFYAIDPDSVTGDLYAGLLPEEDFVALENLDLAALPFRVLAMGDQDTGFQDKLSLNLGRCSAYE